MSQNSTDGLTPKQEQAIVALLNEPTVTRAARALGVNDRTLYRWLDDPTFSGAYRRARRRRRAAELARDACGVVCGGSLRRAELAAAFIALPIIS